MRRGARRALPLPLSLDCGPNEERGKMALRFGRDRKTLVQPQITGHACACLFAPSTRFPFSVRTVLQTPGFFVFFENVRFTTTVQQSLT
jgi:hypothetical protein